MRVLGSSIDRWAANAYVGGLKLAFVRTLCSKTIDGYVLCSMCDVLNTSLAIQNYF